MGPFVYFESFMNHFQVISLDTLQYQVLWPSSVFPFFFFLFKITSIYLTEGERAQSREQLREKQASLLGRAQHEAPP